MAASFWPEFLSTRLFELRNLRIGWPNDYISSRLQSCRYDYLNQLGPFAVSERHTPFLVDMELRVLTLRP